MKRYMLHPGPVISRTDGDRHFIGSRDLARLYSVPMAECVVYEDRRIPPYSADYLATLTHLYPRSDGDYRIDRAAEGKPRG